MEEEQIDLIVKMTIDGTSFKDVEVKVNDPSKTIRDQINSIIDVFELPKTDKRDMPVLYLIGQEKEDDEAPEILEFEDETGREQSLLDYNIQPGDRLRVITVPCAYGCPIPNDFQQQTSKDFLFLKIKRFFNRLLH